MDKKYIVVANFFGFPYLCLGYVKEIVNDEIIWTCSEQDALVVGIDELYNVFAKVWEFSKNPEKCDVYPASLEVFADGTISKTFSYVKRVGR